MNFKIIYSFCLFLSLILTLSANNSQQETAFKYTDTKLIIQEARSALLDHHKDRLYIDQDRVMIFHDGTYILLDDGSDFFSTSTKVDEYGVYLPIPVMSKPGEKFFICICNDCGHRWYGGAFTWRCPKENCLSTNFRTVPKTWVD